jgi:hypothetical protein
MEAHEEAVEAGHEHGNKQIALLISVLALFLAFSEALGKNAQTSTLRYNGDASDTWAFYQSRNIRSTVVSTQKEVLAVELQQQTDPARKEAIAKQIGEWDSRLNRWESDPQKREGMKELAEKAKRLEALRDLANERYHNFEFASGALQIGIVLASASIITGIALLAWVSGGLGVVGLLFIAIGLFAPATIQAVL